MYGLAEIVPNVTSALAIQIYNQYPDLFSTPFEADWAIKWWQMDVESLIRYLNYLRRAKYEPKVYPESDPEAIVLE
jgi:hypothetical protein